jgi:hypothetical protein
MNSMPGGDSVARPREWLAMPGGRIRPVVSVPGKDGDTELLPYDAWLARLGPDLRGRGVHRGPDQSARVTAAQRVTTVQTVTAGWKGDRRLEG